MSKWLLVSLLALQAHFAASYLVPLDAKSQGEFGGLLRWFWPWADGDGGPLGRVTVASGNPLVGIYLAGGAGLLFILAALAAAGMWVPAAWLRPLTAVGAGLLVCLMVLFFGPTKIIPAGVAALTLYAVLREPALLAMG